jgi:hypothetical protein
LNNFRCYILEKQLKIDSSYIMINMFCTCVIYSLLNFPLHAFKFILKWTFESSCTPISSTSKLHKLQWKKELSIMLSFKRFLWAFLCSCIFRFWTSRLFITHCVYLLRYSFDMIELLFALRCLWVSICFIRFFTTALQTSQCRQCLLPFYFKNLSKETSYSMCVISHDLHSMIYNLSF